MFSTYAEAQKWIEAGQALHGKRAFAATEEYKAAYPEIERLYKAENPTRKKRVRVEMPIFGATLLLHCK